MTVIGVTASCVERIRNHQLRRIQAIPHGILNSSSFLIMRWPPRYPLSARRTNCPVRRTLSTQDLRPHPWLALTAFECARPCRWHATRLRQRRGPAFCRISAARSLPERPPADRARSLRDIPRGGRPSARRGGPAALRRGGRLRAQRCGAPRRSLGGGGSFRRSFGAVGWPVGSPGSGAPPAAWIDWSPSPARVAAFARAAAGAG